VLWEPDAAIERTFPRIVVDPEMVADEFAMGYPHSGHILPTQSSSTEQSAAYWKRVAQWLANNGGKCIDTDKNCAAIHCNDCFLQAAQAAVKKEMGL